LIKAIFATDIQGGMGNQGSLPWPYDKEDLRNFKQETSGHIVVMGSNTWLDPMMPKPLPNRTCVVVTNQGVKPFNDAHEVIAGDWLKESLEMLEQHNPDKIVWIIGGAKLLMSCHPYIREIKLTTFMTEYDCDVKLNMHEFLRDFGRNTESFGRNKTYSTWARQCKS
jgi:dihydrofolate reductase